MVSNSLLQRKGSSANLDSNKKELRMSGTSATSSSVKETSNVDIMELLSSTDLGKMEVLRRLSFSSSQDYADVYKFIHLDKEFDNEEKMLEFIKFLMERNQLPPMVSHIIKQEIDGNDLIVIDFLFLLSKQKRLAT
jgi:hypothetical protein